MGRVAPGEWGAGGKLRATGSPVRRVWFESPLVDRLRSEDWPLSHRTANADSISCRAQCPMFRVFSLSFEACKSILRLAFPPSEAGR